MSPQRLIAQFANRVFQQLTVQFVSDRRDVTALLRPEQVPCPANFQVTHGDLESCSQGRELLNRLEAGRRLRGNEFVIVQEQVGVGPVLVPSDAAAQLVQICQAVVVGLVDENGVGVGNIQSAFDDRGGNE